ncbi:MAG: hypothetical protein OEU54_00795 [Gemmatimonadota bacterium]|nr:hypothetical protein [Gemmatimonadota bacterium]
MKPTRSRLATPGVLAPPAVAVLLWAAALTAQETPAREGPVTDPLVRFDLAGPAEFWRLPGRLTEISGLAVSPDGRLFAHDDERAVIYELDVDRTEMIKAFAMGDQLARADFEGLAIAGERFYLVTSDGRIYESREGADDERVLYNTYGTGIGRWCEVEGLAHEHMDDTLLILCKTARDSSLESSVTVFRWSLATRELVDPPLSVPLEHVEEATDQRGFAASGIARDPMSGDYVLIAAQDRAVVSMTREGVVLGGGRLDADRHPQAEGVILDAMGRLLIADEGRGARARITVYPPRPPE